MSKYYFLWDPRLQQTIKSQSGEVLARYEIERLVRDFTLHTGREVESVSQDKKTLYYAGVLAWTAGEVSGIWDLEIRSENLPTSIRLQFRSLLKVYLDREIGQTKRYRFRTEAWEVDTYAYFIKGSYDNNDGRESFHLVSELPWKNDKRIVVDFASPFDTITDTGEYILEEMRMETALLQIAQIILMG